MSFTFVVMAMLLGSSVVIAFVLQPSKEEAAAPHHRYQGESLQSIRKGLLSSLNLQVEPQLRAGRLDAVREQWWRTFSHIANKAKDAAVPAPTGSSVSPDGGNGTCCSMASELFMTDLGWDNWMIHPDRLTIVQCALCGPEGDTALSAASHTNVQDADSQARVPCCQPTSQVMVPVVYMDELNAVVISSVRLTRSCGCAPGDVLLPGHE